MAADPSASGEQLLTREDAIVEFASKFPIDDHAANRLRGLPDDQLQRVFNDFRPVEDGNPDYSRRLMGFMKQVANSGMGMGGGGMAMGGGGAPGEYSGPIVSMEQLEMFRQQYPMDDRAYDYLKISPPDVQERVISTFRAQGVQEDYSRMVTSHIKFCMGKRSGGGCGGGGYGGYQQQQQPTVSVEAAYQAITGTGMLPSSDLVPEETLEQFRAQYPMDDRAYDYLKSAPPEVQQRVVTSFRVDAQGQADYSRAVTGHVRFCLRQHRDQTNAPMQVPMGATAEQVVQAIADFQAKFPMDERALNYLLQSSAQAKQRVLTEFRPQPPADGDYSKAVTAFVRKCRDDERGGGGFQGQMMGGPMGGGMGGGGGYGQQMMGPGGGQQMMGGGYGGGGGAASGVEQAARQLVAALGQVGGQGPGVQQATNLVQQALHTVAQAADGGQAWKRPRLAAPTMQAPMMQGGYQQPRGMVAPRPAFGGCGPGPVQWRGPGGIGGV